MRLSCFDSNPGSMNCYSQRAHNYPPVISCSFQYGIGHLQGEFFHFILQNALEFSSHYSLIIYLFSLLLQDTWHRVGRIKIQAGVWYYAKRILHASEFLSEKRWIEWRPLDSGNNVCQILVQGNTRIHVQIMPFYAGYILKGFEYLR